MCSASRESAVSTKLFKGDVPRDLEISLVEVALPLPIVPLPQMLFVTQLKAPDLKVLSKGACLEDNKESSVFVREPKSAKRLLRICRGD